MGSACSCVNSSKVVDVKTDKGSSKTGSVVGKKTDGSFHQIITSLPKLFCECITESGRYLCSCNATPNSKLLVFACADVANSRYYQKEVTLDELKEIKNALDFNNELDWPSFFTALKESFEKRTMSFDFENNPNGSCILGLELSLAKVGRVSIQLKLRLSTNRAVTLSSSFLAPLYDIYTSRSDPVQSEKVEELERRLNLLKEKYIFMKSQQKKQQTVGEKSKDQADEGKERLNKGARTDFEYPNDEIVRFLRQMKKKLIADKTITDVDHESLNCVARGVALDNTQVLEPNTKSDNNIEPETVSLLKTKYSGEEKRKIPKDLKPEQKSIIAVMDKMDDWNFDVFALEEVTKGQPLLVLGYALFVKYDLVTKFNMDEKVLINFLKRAEGAYRANPYHNSTHAADVLQVMHHIIYKCKLSQYMADEDIFAALLAAIVHDLDHPGLNNSFQVDSETFLARIYNDRSVLENHHCASAFELMRNEQSNILASLSSEQLKDIRETVIQMILATDLVNHDKYIAKLKGRIENDADFSSKEDVRLTLQIALKTADISNVGKQPLQYLKWSDRMIRELGRQDPSQSAQFKQTETEFITKSVVPLFEISSKLLPRLEKTVSGNLEKNKSYWDSHETVDPNDLNPSNE